MMQQGRGIFLGGDKLTASQQCPAGPISGIGLVVPQGCRTSSGLLTLAESSLPPIAHFPSGFLAEHFAITKGEDRRCYFARSAAASDTRFDSRAA